MGSALECLSSGDSYRRSTSQRGFAFGDDGPMGNPIQKLLNSNFPCH